MPASTPFWNRVISFASAAAKDLDIQLDVFDGHLERLRMLKQLQLATNATPGYAAFIFPNFLKSGGRFIAAAQAKGIPCILFNSELDTDDKASMGTPREIYPLWIAQLIPDDFGSSQVMAHQLIRAALQTLPPNSSRPLEISAIDGLVSDGPAIAREQGLRAALHAYPEAHLDQLFYTDWSESEAFTRTMGLMQRYPNVRAIWSANYRSTQGILRALDKRGRKPGTDIWVNSYDIDPDTLRNVENGRVLVTAGGHYVEGAWAVILAYDYLHHHDFVKDGVVFHTPLLVVNQGNVAKVRQALLLLENDPSRLDDIDFRQFSKSFQQSPAPYQFSLARIIEQLH